MAAQVKIKIRNLFFCYKAHAVLENINADIEQHTITSITGPSGQGKSSFLTVFNRLWHDVDGASVKGDVKIDFGNGLQDIYDKSFALSRLRRKVGMVFQLPNPLPMSIYKNMEFPLKLAGEKEKSVKMNKIEQALKKAYLWDEVKDRLYQGAQQLSGGQQQRLCIARALMHDPQVLLLDEPTSSLDDTAVRKIEQLLLDLKSRCTILMVSHYMDQVKRIADQTYLLSDKQLSPV